MTAPTWTFKEFTLVLRETSDPDHPDTILEGYHLHESIETAIMKRNAMSYLKTSQFEQWLTILNYAIKERVCFTWSKIHHNPVIVSTDRMPYPFKNLVRKFTPLYQDLPVNTEAWWHNDEAHLIELVHSAHSPTDLHNLMHFIHAIPERAPIPDFPDIVTVEDSQGPLFGMRLYRVNADSSITKLNAVGPKRDFFDSPFGRVIFRPFE